MSNSIAQQVAERRARLANQCSSKITPTNNNTQNNNHDTMAKPVIFIPKSKQEALVSGYIRESTKSFPFTLPIALIQLCFAFFNTIKYFTFKNETLKSFLKSTKEDIWEDKPFNMHGIMCRFVLSPNGYENNQIGFFLEITDRSPSIHKAVIQVTLYCHETGTFYTKSQNTDKGDRIGTDYMASISDCMDKKCLTFSGHINVLQIHYKYHVAKPVWFGTNIRMRNKNSNCEWIIHKKSLKKKIHFGKYIDNRNWVLFYDAEYVGYEFIKLRLLDLPRNIISVSVKTKTTLKYYNNNKVFYENTTEFNHVFTLATNTRRLEGVTHQGWKEVDKHGRHIHMDQVEKVLVRLEFEIYEVCKQNIVTIKKSEWEKYGIIN